MHRPPEMDHPIIVDAVDLDLWADLYKDSLAPVTLSEFLQQPYLYLKQAGLPVSSEATQEAYPVTLPVRKEVARQIQDEWACQQQAQQSRQQARRHLTLITCTPG